MSKKTFESLLVNITLWLLTCWVSHSMWARVHVELFFKFSKVLSPCLYILLCRWWVSHSLWAGAYVESIIGIWNGLADYLSKYWKYVLLWTLSDRSAFQSTHCVVNFQNISQVWAVARHNHARAHVESIIGIWNGLADSDFGRYAMNKVAILWRGLSSKFKLFDYQTLGLWSTRIQQLGFQIVWQHLKSWIKNFQIVCNTQYAWFEIFFRWKRLLWGVRRALEGRQAYAKPLGRFMIILIF